MSTINDLPPSAEILTTAGSFRFAQDTSGLGHRLQFKVKWEESAAFLQAVKGYPVKFGQITRRIPLQSPYFSNLYAVAISDCEGKGADANIGPLRPFPWLVFTIEFAALPFGLDGDTPFISLRESGSSRSVTVPGRQYGFPDGTKIQQDVGIPIGGVGLQLSVSQLPDRVAFVTAALPMLGKVNSSAVTVGGVTYPAGCLLLETYDTDTTQGLLGTTQVQATASLIYSALPWNKAIRPNGVPDDVVPAPFGTADLNTLIM